ncbi:MAG: DUF3048 domain-containing protein [Eubacterium sp.]
MNNLFNKIKKLIINNKKAAISIMAGVIVLSGVVAVLANGVLFNGEETITTETEMLTTTAETTTEETTTADLHEGQAQSYLTGEWVNKKIANRRPYAIMINNINAALPQSGIEKAGVIYECPVEGGLTRLMAYFEDCSDISRIGSIRSCRLYYCYFALEFDAIYVHYGQSKYAESFLNSTKIDNISGLSSIGNSSFYRSSDFSSPHNVFTDKEKLDYGASANGYSTKYSDEYNGHYIFADDGETVQLSDGKKANTVNIGYPVNKPYFVYNKKTNLYSRYQYGAEHIDGLTGNQLTCTNIIIQFNDTTLYDDGKSLNMTVTGSGSGYYATGGRIIPITWKKDSISSVTHYYNENGDEITLNIGKTWVEVVQSSQSSNVTFAK